MGSLGGYFRAENENDDRDHDDHDEEFLPAHWRSPPLREVMQPPAVYSTAGIIQRGKIKIKLAKLRRVW